MRKSSQWSGKIKMSKRGGVALRTAPWIASWKSPIDHL
jgi:hypothetical protein